MESKSEVSIFYGVQCLEGAEVDTPHFFIFWNELIDFFSERNQQIFEKIRKGYPYI